MGRPGEEASSRGANASGIGARSGLLSTFMRAALCLFSLSVATALPTTSLSAQPLLHEYFEYTTRESDADDDLPDVPRPGAFGSDGTSPTQGAPVVFTPDGMMGDNGNLRGPNGADRQDGPVTLDRETDTEPRLEYAAVFTPSVAPFKRLGTRDAVVDVGGSYELVTADPVLRQAPSTLPADVPFDAFIGRLSVSTVGGAEVPLPSVSPDMAVVSVVTRPNVAASVWVDGGGNFSLVLARDGEFEVELLAHAPRRYFGGVLPEPRPLGPPRGGQRLRADVEQVLRAANVDDARTDTELLVGLLRWFRAFEARPYPDARRTNNAYLDIALARIGVCRHRAQTFAITAWAAGMDARYVYNDAHAFVEVALSDGWRRFDLGGASDGLDVVGTSADEQHEPPDDPTLDRAPIADDSSSALGPENFPDAAAPANEHPAGGESAASHGGGRSELPDTPRQTDDPPGERGHVTTLRSIVQPIGADTPADVRMRGGQQVVEFEPARPLNPDSRLTLAPFDDRVYRGEPVRLRGQLVDASGRPLANRQIDVHVGPRDAGELDAPIERVGSLRTDANGRFDGAVQLSPVLPLGEWGLYVSFAGDDDAGPAPPPR